MSIKLLKAISRGFDIVFRSPEHLGGRFYRAHMKLCRPLKDWQFFIYHLLTFWCAMAAGFGFMAMLPVPEWISFPFAFYIIHYLIYAPMVEFHIRLNATYEADLKAGKINTDSWFHRFCDRLDEKFDKPANT